MNKTILIGLDGVNFELIRAWLEINRLPNLGRLIKEGILSDLKSIIPVHTPSAWTSIMTGKDIDQHGIYDFFEMDTHAYQPRFNTSSDVHVPYLWELAEQHGLKSIVINIPITHPPRPFNGILIPGTMAPENPPCHPNGILDEIRGAIGAYQVYWPNEVDDSASFTDKIDGFLKLINMRWDAARYLSQNYPWDLLIIQFQRTDSAFHILNKELSHKTTNQVLRLFIAIDEILGEILNLYPDATLFIVSDHGMGHTKWMFAVNSWLKTKGYLQTKVDKNWQQFEIDDEFSRLANPTRQSDPKSVDKILGILAELGLTKTRIEHWLRIIKLDKFVIRYLPYRWLKTSGGAENIDWQNSKAFCYQPSGGGIWINLKGRQLKGIVEPGKDYDSICDQLVQELSTLTDPNGYHVFEMVTRREEIYAGPQALHIPDIIWRVRFDDYKIEKRIRGSFFIANENYYAHKTNGLFLVNGPMIDKNKSISTTPSILDVAPTILCAMGLPPDPSMNGTPLINIFDDNYLDSIPSPSDYDLNSYQVVPESDQIDRVKLENHLKALGYLD
jgi:predicted AlkP superfamily phosphohydrolase/phosphomutase